jgi:hypothetical protein
MEVLRFLISSDAQAAAAVEPPLVFGYLQAAQIITNHGVVRGVWKDQFDLDAVRVVDEYLVLGEFGYNAFLERKPKGCEPPLVFGQALTSQGNVVQGAAARTRRAIAEIGHQLTVISCQVGDMHKRAITDVHPLARERKGRAPTFLHANGVTKKSDRFLDLRSAQGEMVDMKNRHRRSKLVIRSITD